MAHPILPVRCGCPALVFRAWILGSLFFFSTVVHKFAQTFSSNSIDAANGEDYLPHRLNRKRKDFAVRFRPRDILTVVAILIGTGKFEDFQIQRECCKSLTAIAVPSWTGEFRDIKVRFRGCDSLNAIAALDRIRSL